MGIPAAFRWLSAKYPKIISPVIEDKPVVLEDGTVVPVDATQPNPNGEEFDNLYLDMNGIVHPCSHPEDKPAPKDEEEMMIEIFKYTDRVVNMVRPRKLLMIAVDGVAPRAKMNQQRSRRFRAAQEAKEKEQDRQQLLKMLRKENGSNAKEEPVETVVKKAFDSNSITPGTPFMDILAASLRYWCAYKLNTDPAWAKLKVIISDATVPGEGEHKIMEFVRSQRNSPEHDPNTRHVIYGLDADLIMLGLATHEPHFRVLREDVFFQEAKARMCKLCGQKGHDERNCKGEAKQKDGEFDEKDKALPLKPFIWLHVSILREYLAVELSVPNLPFRWDLERAIDDWVFMCFFVGNDFLPHLPALDIRENGIDTLTAIWKDNLPVMGGYVTKDGHVDLERAQYILAGLAKQEDAIFRRRKETEDRREASIKRRKLNNQQGNGRGGAQDSPLSGRGRNRAPEANGPPAGMNLFPVTSIHKPVSLITHDMVMNRRALEQANVANKSAASVLKSQIQGLMSQAQAKADGGGGGGDGPKKEDGDGKAPKSPPSALGKRKAELLEEDGKDTPDASSDAEAAAGSDEEGPVDTVRLWEEGYADRYYEQKFKVDPKDIAFRHKVARAYTEGLAWVLMYYFQGCPSWEWFYPYHYAPFAADFVDIGKMKISFEKGRISRPFEQLMSVLPAASRHAIPEVFHDLMTDKDSPILDFYPEEFEIDLNGKKMAWQGVALLPFIEMPRLLAAMETRAHLLSAEDQLRNTPGKDVLLISDAHTSLYEDITSQFYSKKQGVPKFKLNPKKSGGLAGKVEKIEGYVPHGSLVYPLERNTMPDVDYDRSLSVHYYMPSSSSHTHKSMLLRGVKLPPPALDRSDIEMIKSKGQRSGRSYGGVPLKNNYNDGGRGGDRINYAGGPPRSQGSRDRGGYQQSDRGYGNGYGNGYGTGYGDGYGGGYAGGSHQQRYAPPPSWQPPPPGYPGFGVGVPPPPPPVHLPGGSYGQGYGHLGYGQGYRNDHYAPGPPAHGGYQGGYQGYQGQQYRPPAPHQDRRYDNRYGGDGRGRNYRDSRGY
ncbi:c8e39d56-f89c-4092-b2d9-03b55bb07610 [Thermothielavioides terrestris]|uniref:5'-3' exoribonuclease n=1 Tax=Thermothielavioides terrestris TaxID=2587410 RepID=A0A3S4BRS0_9PEZI|nr:c8e39d56-f89c-4092-b2d9-03b55bb07610 [Thermothielavioides terrestris]